MRRNLLVCGLIHTEPAGRGCKKERLILAAGDAHSSSSWSPLEESMHKPSWAHGLAPGADGAATSWGSGGWGSSLLGHCSYSHEE